MVLSFIQFCRLTFLPFPFLASEKSWSAEPANRPGCDDMVKELEAITEIYHQNQDAWNNLRTTPPTISKKQYYLSRTGKLPALNPFAVHLTSINLRVDENTIVFKGLD